MKYRNKPTNKFRSKLESVCNDLLQQSKLSYKYESTTITLVDSFDYQCESYERIGKNWKTSNKVRAVKYVPDFVIKGKKNTYLIETKGFLTPVARLKWKLLKRYLFDNRQNIILFMPTNKTEIIKTIDIIKSKESGK